MPEVSFRRRDLEDTRKYAQGFENFEDVTLQEGTILILAMHISYPEN